MIEMQLRSSDLARVIRDVQQAGNRGVARQVSAPVRAELRPVVTEMRARINAIASSTGTQRTGKSRRDRPRGLRDASARGVQSKVNVSGSRFEARIRVDRRHFPENDKDLPELLDGQRRWRAPSWGRKSGPHDWHTMRPHPFFMVTIQPHIPRVQAVILREVDRINRELAGGGQ